LARASYWVMMIIILYYNIAAAAILEISTFLDPRTTTATTYTKFEIVRVSQLIK